jgi:hypothetical protein
MRGQICTPGNSLGLIDPSKEPYRTRIEATPGITVINLSEVAGEGARHSKFAESGEVREFARRTLADNATAEAERTAIGEVAGAVIVTLGQGVAKVSK